MVKIIINIITWVLIFLDIVLILDLYILLRRKRRFILWNFGKVLSTLEIKGVIGLLKENIPEMKLNVMIINYGAKWQIYILELFTIIQSIIYNNLKKSTLNKYWTIINDDGVGGTHNYMYKLITLHEFKLQCNNDLEKKVLAVGNLIHELRHFYHSCQNTDLSDIEEEIDCYNFEMKFIKDNISALNEILNTDEEIESICMNFDEVTAKKLYKQFYEQGELPENCGK